MTETKQTVAGAVMRGHSIDLRGSTWQVFRIMAEFVEGYQFLSQLTKQVTVFGSARTPSSSKFYKIAESLGQQLAAEKYTVITGGGPGVMEAANKGAYQHGGTSVGLNIELPHEQHLNPFVQHSLGFYYFLTRKVMLTTPSLAFVYMPGGFGTMDELFEVLDQMRYGQISRAPIILIDKTYWEPVIHFLRSNVFERIHALQEIDLSMIHAVDTAEEGMEIIRKTKTKPQVCAMDAAQFCSDDAVNWRVFRIMAELVEGFAFLEGMGPVITILGTPRVNPDSQYCKDAYVLGQMIAKKKVGVLTAGGGGVHEAANKGAFEMGRGSYGMDMHMQVSGEHERANPYLTKSHSFAFPFTRKLMLTTPSRGFVLFPGGYGTLNLCFEILTLIQTGKLAGIPIVLYGGEFWRPLLKFIQENQFEQEHNISKEDLN